MPMSKEIQNVAIVGTGVIGASWAALYLARGLNVVATDPAPNAEANSGEVEAVISEHPAVEEAAVFGIPDPQWVELVAACVVLKPGMALSMQDLIGYCRQFLANYKIPRRVEFSETELPKSGSGKILKRILRER